MIQQIQTDKNYHPRLVWVYLEEILKTFNYATFLEITKEMRNLGWQVDLIAPGPAGKHIFQGVEIMCLPRPNIYLVRNLIFHYRVIRYIFRNWKQIDVVMYSQLSAQWVLPLQLLRISKGNYPVFVMDTRTVPMESAETASLRDKFRGQFTLLMNKVANRFADGQTTITSRMADYLSIPLEKLLGTWPSGVNEDLFSSAAKNRVWPGINDPVVIIYIGTMNYERNLMALCRAVVEANSLGMDFVLWLYGEGNEKKDLKVFADQTNGYIKVFDVIPNEQVPDVLACAHVGALPFPNEEKYWVSSPIKLFEYMGAGMPILATKIDCHTDVIDKGDYAFWAEGSDVDSLLEALKKTWEARSSLKTLGEKALSASKDWTWATSAKRLDAALKHGLSLHSKG